MKAAGLLAAIALACTPRTPPTPDAAPRPVAIELRATHGELLLALTPADGSWTVEVPGAATLTARTSSSGVVLVDHDGQQRGELRTTPGGAAQLVEPVGPDRVTFPAPRWVDVINPNGVMIVKAQPTADGAVGHDAAGAPALVAHLEPDRILLQGPSEVVVGTVHHTRDAVVAVVLGSDGISLPSRAALAIYILTNTR